MRRTEEILSKKQGQKCFLSSVAVIPFVLLLAQVTRVDARKLSLKVDTTKKSPAHLRDTLSVLSRTRESLSKSGCFSSLPGQVLEKVLGKQINSRLGELSSSSSSPLPPQDVPVAIGNLTPAY